MEKKFEGENLMHLLISKKKRSFWSFNFFDHLPLSVKYGNGYQNTEIMAKKY